MNKSKKPKPNNSGTIHILVNKRLVILENNENGFERCWMMDEDDIISDYTQTLEDLTFNSKPHINALTILASENEKDADKIVMAIQNRLKDVGFIRFYIFFVFESAIKISLKIIVFNFKKLAVFYFATFELFLINGVFFFVSFICLFHFELFFYVRWSSPSFLPPSSLQFSCCLHLQASS